MNPDEVTTWTPALREEFEERAGIKEFDGKIPRAEAERQARVEVWAARGELF